MNMCNGVRNNEMGELERIHTKVSQIGYIVENKMEREGSVCRER